MDFHSLARRDLQCLCKKNRIPANLTNVAMAKALEALEIVEGIEEIQEVLGCQSLKVKSLEPLHTERRTSSRRSRQAASKDIEVIDMTYEEEGEKKEVPHIFPKTPATRKPAKRAEGQSSRRRAKKNEEVENHTKTPKGVEVKGGKAIGVVTRRSAILSSRKAFEDSVTTQSNGRSSSREHSAVKMKVLGKEDISDQEKKEEMKDIDEYGNSYAVIVEESEKKDEEAESREFTSSVDVDDSNNEVENECEAIHENVPMIQQQQPSPHRRCSRATTKALEASKIASKKKEDGRKASKLLPNTRRSTRLSSRIPVEEKSREEGAVKMVDLTEENAEEQEREEENKDHAKKIDSCIVASVEEDEEKNKKEESHGCSIVALVDEVKEKDHEVESHGFSSSSQEDDSNDLVENGDSTVAIVEGDQNNDQELEVQVLSSSIGRDNSNVELKNDVTKNHELSSFSGENSMDQVHEPFESMEESSDQPLVNEYVKDSCKNSPENENSIEDCGNHSSENGLVDDFNNQGSEFVGLSGVLFPANGAAENSVNHLPASEHIEDSLEPSSDAKLAISAVSDNLLCSETSQSPHGEAIVCTERSSEILDEEENLSLLFTKMTLADALLDPVGAQEAFFASTKLPEAMAIAQEADLITTADIVFPQDDSSSAEPAPLILPLFSENVDATTNPDNGDSVTRAIGETREEEEESGSVLASKIPAAIEESIDDDLSDVGKLTNNDSVDIQGTSFEPRILVSSTELCTEFSSSESTMELPDRVKESSGEIPSDLPAEIKESLEDNLTESRELAANGFVNELQKAETLPEAFGDLPSEISAVIGESVEAGLPPNFDEYSSEKSVDTEISQDASFEPRIPVPSPAKLCFDFSATTLATISSPLKLPCDTETMSPVESSIVQTQSSAEASMALEKEVFLKEGNLELLSLTKLRAMYKLMLNSTKAEEERKKSTIKEEDLEGLGGIKQEQKLNVDTMKLETKRSAVIKQAGSDCLSRSSKLDSNCKQKLNDDMTKLERKRTPLKSLNYSTF